MYARIRRQLIRLTRCRTQSSQARIYNRLRRDWERVTISSAGGVHDASCVAHGAGTATLADALGYFEQPRRGLAEAAVSQAEAAGTATAGVLQGAGLGVPDGDVAVPFAGGIVIPER